MLGRKRTRDAAAVGDDAEDAALAALLGAVAGGDRAALGEVYDLTGARLFGVALRLLRRRDLAEEVLHDAFLRVWARAGSYSSDRGAALAWLTTLVRHVALDNLRRRRREVSLEDAPELAEAAEVEAGDDGPFARVSTTSEGRALMGCLGELEREPRLCILLAYRDGYSHEELARLLGRPLGTVKSWVRRSLLRLRQCLER